MFPKVLAAPTSTCTPNSPKDRINRTSYTPDVGIMMRHPAPCAIHHACRFSSRLRHILNHVEKGLMQFCKVSFLSRPIVHLRIDVNRVFAVPRWFHLIVPNSLKVGRLTTWPR